MSDDGASAVVIIALLGNPFSPAYARARRTRGAEALAYCSMNVAVYARGASAWALEERRLGDRDRSAHGVQIGASTMRWDGDRLVVEIDERTTPFGRHVRGRVLLRPEAHSGLELSIDELGQHRWWPVAPLARIEVDLPLPGLRFSGHGYHDANAGARPLDEAFETWSWSRARSESAALLTYDVACASGSTQSLAFKVSSHGDIEDLPHMWNTPLPRTVWGLPRQARVDEGRTARLARSLEDGPFYARALLETELGGQKVLAMHETLSAHRLRRGWVRALAGFRMRRVE